MKGGRKKKKIGFLIPVLFAGLAVFSQVNIDQLLNNANTMKQSNQIQEMTAEELQAIEGGKNLVEYIVYGVGYLVGSFEYTLRLTSGLAVS